MGSVEIQPWPVCVLLGFKSRLDKYKGLILVPKCDLNCSIVYSNKFGRYRVLFTSLLSVERCPGWDKTIISFK